MTKLRRTIDYKVPQEVAIERGANKQRRLIGMLMRFAEANQQEAYSHLVISSFPGLGKTYLTMSIFNESDIPYFVINGNISMFGFGIALAVIQMNNPALLSINVLIDDCDSFFNDVNSLNTLKNVLGTSGEFRYEKSLSSQINFLTETQKKAINHFAGDGRMGFVVPTHNLRFVFTSNISLPTDQIVFDSLRKFSAKTKILMHQNAIRSRCRCMDIELTEEEKWGWIVSTITTTDCLTSKGITRAQVQDICDFLYIYWGQMKERSIRTSIKMAETILANPDPRVYQNIWEIDFVS
jgi:hypothetical protein